MKVLALILFTVLFIQDSSATTCTGILRELLNKEFSAGVEVILPTEEVGTTYKSRYRSFLEIFGAILRGARTSYIRPKALDRFLESKQGDPELKETILFLEKELMSTQNVEVWIQSLYQDLITEMYRPENAAFRQDYETSFAFSRDLVLKVLQEQLKLGGIRSEYVTETDSPLSPEAFGQALMHREIILDTFFQGKKHGDFIHIFQLDLIIFIASSKGKDPQSIGNLYEWMGYDRLHILEGDVYFSPLKSVWDTFFDSFAYHITQPEIFNPFIEKFLGWRR